jgi:hypothetical protein
MHRRSIGWIARTLVAAAALALGPYALAAGPAPAAAPEGARAAVADSITESTPIAIDDESATPRPDEPVGGLSISDDVVLIILIAVLGVLLLVLLILLI